MTAARPVIRVLVVEDSAACRDLLVGLIDADPRLQVVGVAQDGEAAVQAAARLRPDVIAMDIHLPLLDGFAATRRIMESCPTRIVMVTASSVPHEVAESFEALQSGALTVLGKPVAPGHAQFAALRDELLRTLVLMAEVPVVRRWPAARTTRALPLPAGVPAHRRSVSLVAIGASTGGPLALQALLSRLRPGFSAPIVVVQHIALGFAEGLAQWLSRSTGHAVRVGAHGECLQPGVAYVAVDGLHTTVRADGCIALIDTPPEHGYRPAVACLFRSVAQHVGARAVGVLLTGMGRDGAQELKAMRLAGALTMVQDSASAAVYGMPGEALRLDAAMHVLAPEQMAAALNELLHQDHAHMGNQNTPITTSTTAAAAPPAEILLVEDSPTQAVSLQHLLESHGYRTRAATHGRAALQAMKESRPDLVLSDVVMPEMDGYALCRAIRADPALADTPVILITSLIDTTDIVSGLECGADNFVRKPYAPGYLLKRIRHVLLNHALRKSEGPRADQGIALYLQGKKHFVAAERQQILDLLVSSYEQAVAVNEEVQAREQQISELNAHLERRAEELELVNAEMARKNVELQRASGLKSEFMASMSHELRTPLNAIMGFSEMLKDGMLGEISERQRSSASAIFDSGMHLLSLINDILDLSRIEAGRMDLDLEKTDVAELLDNSVSMLKGRASSHGIRLEVESQVSDAVNVDKRKARQIVYNLLSNAVKFTPDGGAVTLQAKRVASVQAQGMQRVDAAPLLDSHGYLEIAVVDTGIGIAASDIGRLFRPFSQLDSGQSRKYEGTGLGLVLVKQLVELHGGALAVTSRPGHGTTFKVWLPCRDTVSAAAVAALQH